MIAMIYTLIIILMFLLISLLQEKVPFRAGQTHSPRKINKQQENHKACKVAVYVPVVELRNNVVAEILHQCKYRTAHARRECSVFSLYTCFWNIFICSKKR